MCLTFYPLLKEVNIYEYNCMLHCCCFSVSQFCLTLCNSMGCSMPGFPVLHHLLELPTLMSIELVMPCNQLILCHPLLLLPSIFPSIRVFSNETVLRIKWPKHWILNFSISPSNEYSGLISFQIDSCDLLAVQGTSAPQFKSINSSMLSFLYSPTLTSIHDY